MTVKIDNFHGISPRTHASLLADGMAVTAHNVRLKNGKIVPIRNPRMVDDVPLLLENGLSEVADARTMHAWKRRDGSVEFLLFPGITWMAEGNIADDERTRVVISGDTGESFTDEKGKEWKNTPVVYMRDPGTGAAFPHVLSKRALAPAKVARADGSPPLDDANKRYTYFFVTWVDAFGYESPVSSPSLVQKDGEWEEGDLEYNDGDSVSFEKIENLPDEAESVRVYKVVTGTEEGRIQFVAERKPELAREGFAVTVKDEDAGEVMTEIENPLPDLRCICDVPGAYYCGFSKTHPKTVCFSEVDMLYSWPVAYRYDVRDNVVALAVTSNTVFALTDGWPYVLSGTSPGGMTVSKLAGPAACVSERGVCVYSNAVYYVSNQGLMTIYNSADAGTVCQNLTDKVFTKDQWLALNPSSAIMGQFDGALFLFFTKLDGEHYGLVIDLTETANSITTHDEIAKCLCTDNKTDKLYFVREEGV